MLNLWLSLISVNSAVSEGALCNVRMQIFIEACVLAQHMVYLGESACVLQLLGGVFCQPDVGWGARSCCSGLQGPYPSFCLVFHQVLSEASPCPGEVVHAPVSPFSSVRFAS